MDQRERSGDLFEAFRMALDGRQATMWTALPALVESYDPVKQTIVAQPTSQGRKTDMKGVVSFVDLPLCLDCPVVWTGGGGATLTFPIVKGDECLLVFASREIDNWWFQGGVQPITDARMHDLSDAFAIVGIRSQPRRLSGVSTTTVQLRADDGASYVDLDPAGQIVKIKGPGGIVLDGPVTTTDTLQVAGSAQFNGAALTHNGVNVGDHHKHSGVTTGGDISGDPV